MNRRLQLNLDSGELALCGGGRGPVLPAGGRLIDEPVGQHCWDNPAMKSFFSSLKTERTARKAYRTRDDARADVFDYIERFYNPKQRHSTIGYMSPMDFEIKPGLA